MTDTPKEPHRSFTVRMPLSRYITIGDRAKRDKKNLNQMVNELLVLGLGEGINLDAALVSLLRRYESEKD